MSEPFSGVTLSVPVNQVAPPIDFQRPSPNNFLSFTATGLPPGMAINSPDLGQLSGTPTATGFYSVLITKTNGSYTEHSRLYFNVGDALPVISATNQTTTVGTNFSYQVGINAGNPGLWMAHDLPPNFSITADGTIVGMPTEAGVWYVDVVALYGGVSASREFTITVNPVAGSPASTVQSKYFTARLLVGEYFSVSTGAHAFVLYTDGVPTGGSYTQSYILTDGEFVDIGDGIGLHPFQNFTSGDFTCYATVPGTYRVVIIGSPDPDSDGPPPYTLQVYVTLTVVAPPAVGTPISIQAGADSPLTAPLTVSGLPPGLTMSDSGLITGTPTTPGDYTIIVTDGTSTDTIPITIPGVSTPPGADDPNLVIEINLLTGKATYTNNLPPLYYGDQFVVEINCVPTTQAGDVANVTFFVKEKSEARQYQELLSGLGVSTDGRKFLCPLTTLEGDFLLHSLLLLDDVAPSSGVTYDLQCRYQWSGRKRKSSTLDFVVNRPDDLDPAEP